MRITHLDITDVTLFSAGDYLTKIRSLDFDWEVLTQPGRTASQRHQEAVPTKKKLEFSGEELITVTGVRQTGLNITLFTLGANALLGRLRQGNLRVTTDVDEGSGGADEWEFPYANGTTIEATGDLQIADTAELAALIATAGTSAIKVAAQFQFGGASFAQPMLLRMVTHGSKEGENQTEKVTLSGRGTPTTATGHSILASIVLGTAEVDWAANTGANSYSGTGIFQQADFSFGNNAIQTCSFRIANCGAPTLE